MILKELRKIPLFSNLEATILEEQWRLQNIKIKNYEKGTTVYNQKERCLYLDFIITGSLISYTLSSNGSETVLFEFKENGIIGANILFSDYNFYPLNIYCLENCKILHIKKAAIIEFLYDHTFVMHYIKSLSENSNGMNRKIAMFSKKTLRENIIEYLKQQSILQKSKRITLTHSKKELADYFGVQRPSLFRELKKMKDEQLIQINNHTIQINFTL